MSETRHEGRVRAFMERVALNDDYDGDSAFLRQEFETVEREAMERACKAVCSEWCGQGEPAHHDGDDQWSHVMDDEGECFTECLASPLRALMAARTEAG